MVDHFNYDAASSSEKHDVLLSPRPGALRPDVVNFFGGNGVLALPNTVGQSLGNISPLVAPVLRASKTAVTYVPTEDDPEGTDDGFATGSQISLISAMQARNSARLTVLGSIEMLQDKWFNAKVTGRDGKSTGTVNRDFAQQLTEWAFKEVGVLKASNMEHHLIEEGDANKPASNTTQLDFQNPEIYRVKNDVVCPPLVLSHTPQVNTDLQPGLLGLHLPIPPHPLGPFHPSRRRRHPARILYALALPPPASHPFRIHLQKLHDLLRHIHHSRPTRHLLL